MTYKIIGLVLIGFILSCQQITKTDNNRNNEIDTSKSNLSSISVKLSDEVIEQNLIDQFSDYITFVSNGKAVEAMDLMYPYMFKYLKDQFHEEYTIDETKKMLMEMYKDSQTLPFEIQSSIEGIVNKVRVNDTDLIYIVRYYLHVEKDLDKFSSGGDAIGISSDGGFHWTFIEKDEITTRPILNYRFNNSIINNVLNY